ncbi:recombinase RecA [Anaerobiospirillum sp. NML120448]|uniref:recombinase RecA n=1 Tax=Anaerobiospirillum sp. NML120448 TaxID=2932816 RepID=UPI00248C5115|nr:recombinase RecA [Anaerobiospirillum sp. NML120448]
MAGPTKVKAKEAGSTASTSNKLASNLTSDPKKLKAIEAAMEHIERQFGKGAIMRLGQGELEEIEAIPTGSLTLDLALGVGGLPMGRIIEIYGPESSGKTTLTLELIAQAQKLGKVCAFIDAEHALDPIYAKKLGVKIDDVLISQPDTGEQALDITETLVRSGGIDVIIVDSVAALVPKAEIEGDMGDNHVGLQARLMSQALRKLTGTIKQANCMVVFINQLRMKIGVMFGNPETTTGGNALKYYASVRLDIRKSTPIKEKDTVIGNETKVKVVKNKVAPPFKQANFQILFNYGISKNGELLDLGVQLKFVEKTGAWFAYNGAKIGQGKTNAIRYLDEHPEVADELEGKIRDYFKQNSDYADTVEIGSSNEMDDSGLDDDLPPLDDMDDDLVTDVPDDI